MSELVRTHFSLPKELVDGLDDLAGKGNRNSLAIEILDHEVRRRRLMRILSEDQALINSDEHPEWKGGAYAWVRNMRDEDDKHSREKPDNRLSPAQ